MGTEGRANLLTEENRLIKQLPREARRRLLAICEPIHLTAGEVLGDRGTATRNVYFPTDSYISLVTRVDGRPVLEVGMVGCEGMLGAHLALGVVNDSLFALVQGPGPAWRIPTRAFRQELARSVELQRGLDRYLYVLMAQIASSAACLCVHLTVPRLARWLLMSHDRAHSDDFHVTHESLAYMLGVRRGAITTAAGELQRSGVIEYRRGNISIRNRAGLEAASCTCYVTERQAYFRLFN
jgi:CRP-like cAMP-binding protein